MNNRQTGGSGGYSNDGNDATKRLPRPSLPPTADTTDWERLADAVNGCFCTVVYVSDDKVRRRVFLSLRAAERHVERARQRGQEASVVLAELRPVFVLPDVETSSGVVSGERS